MSEKIMIVDDDAEFREEFKEYFKDYGVVEAKDGKEAIQIFKRPNEIDIVVLDFKMPGLNGIDVLKHLKKLDPDVSVIILTGYGTKEVVIDALREQADDFMEKPVNIEKLKTVIDKILDYKKFGKDFDLSSTEGKMLKVKSYLERNYSRKVTLKDVSSIIHMSPKYLSRIFKETMNMNFNQLKLKIKLNKACELLKKTGLSVEEISYQLGYENPESFIRIFEKNFKTTPACYRSRFNRKKL